MSFITWVYLNLNFLDVERWFGTFHEQISGFVSLGIAGLSIFLAILAYKSYRKSGLRQLRFIILAFSLFTVFLLIETTEELFPLNDDDYDLLLSSIILFILISFFFGIFKAPKRSLT